MFRLWGNVFANLVSRHFYHVSEYSHTFNRFEHVSVFSISYFNDSEHSSTDNNMFKYVLEHVLGPFRIVYRKCQVSLEWLQHVLGYCDLI